MNYNKLFQFILRYSLIGLAVALIALQFLPSQGGRPDVVEITEAPSNPVRSNLTPNHATRNPTDNQTNNTDRQNKNHYPLGTGPVSYASAVKKAAPGIVNIYTAKVVTERTQYNSPTLQFFFGESKPRKRLQTSLGSGVVMSSQGYILTNHHVVAGATEIQVSFSNGESATAQVVGADPDTDLAVLKVAKQDLEAVTLGKSERLAVGDIVLAIGNPFGVGQTVTMGIVSATGRDHIGLNTFESFIQTDAAINPGNSGGGLIDAYGNLIGINTAIFSESGGSQGIGFAIPIHLAKTVMTQIIEHGQVIRGWLGIETRNITANVAQSFQLNTTKGVLVSGVLQQGPADLAGILPGDVITSINGFKVNDSKAALDYISELKPNTVVEVLGLRQAQTFKTVVKLIQRPVRQIQ